MIRPRARYVGVLAAVVLRMPDARIPLLLRATISHSLPKPPQETRCPLRKQFFVAADGHKNPQLHSPMRRAYIRAVTQVRDPVAAPLWSEIQNMPNGRVKIDPALFDVTRERRMNRVEVAKGSVGISSENGNGRILIPLAVFAAEIVFERVSAATQ